ncbi:hypothetical protein NC652_006107 [Populus alba x Populus x berolinensis]|nr:hypothetical protein NC652_006107 [Populus alba x Populus x berolinensis]
MNKLRFMGTKCMITKFLPVLQIRACQGVSVSKGHKTGCFRSNFTRSGLRSEITDLKDGTVMHCWVPKTPKDSKPDLPPNPRPWSQCIMAILVCGGRGESGDMLLGEFVWKRWDLIEGFLRYHDLEEAGRNLVATESWTKLRELGVLHVFQATSCAVDTILFLA